jgi:hypothetical protein
VPVERAGSAGGVLQTGQRIGSAAGIAVTGSISYSQLSSSQGHFASAFRHGISIAASAAAALALVLVDAFHTRLLSPLERPLSGGRAGGQRRATGSR